MYVVVGTISLVIQFLFVLVTEGLLSAKKKTNESLKEKREARQLNIDRKQDAAKTAIGNQTTVMVISLVVFLSIVAGATIWIYDTIQQRRIDSTKILVNRIAERIADDVRAGNPVPVQGDLAERDAWKQPIQLFVDEALLGELYVVRSSGPDRKSGTIDDILSPEIRIASLKEVAGELLNRGSKKVKEKFSETLNRFKDRNKASKPESN